LKYSAPALFVNTGVFFAPRRRDTVQAMARGTTKILGIDTFLRSTRGLAFLKQRTMSSAPLCPDALKMIEIAALSRVGIHDKLKKGFKRIPLCTLK